MQITQRVKGDIDTLIRRARRARDAEQKDRYLVAAHACRGRETADIQAMLARSRGFVQRRACACRDGGIEALTDKPRGGSLAKIRGPAAARLKARLDAGPTPADKVCTLRGRDIQRIAKEELGAEVSLSSVCRTLRAPGCSCPAPRPRHEKQDLEAQTKFKEESAPFVKTVREALTPHGKVRVFFMDEARFGQRGATTREWAKKGSRPTAVKQTRYEWLYLYAAVEPASGVSVALQAPSVNTGTMSVFLKMLADELGPRDHGVLIMDQAGRHKSRALTTPANITILYLPPYSPELNPVERLWACLRSHHLSNRVFDDYAHQLDAGAAAWQQLTPETLKSVCGCPYLMHEFE